MTTKLTSIQFMIGLQHFDTPKHKNLIRKGDEFKFNSFTNKKGKLYKFGLNRDQTHNDLWAMQADNVPYYLDSCDVQWADYDELYDRYISGEINIKHIK
jgi:hypothetical protein